MASVDSTQEQSGEFYLILTRQEGLWLRELLEIFVEVDEIFDQDDDEEYFMKVNLLEVLEALETNT